MALNQRELEQVISLRDEFSGQLKKIETRVGSFEANSKRQWGNIEGFIGRAAKALSLYAMGRQLVSFTQRLVQHAEQIDTMASAYQITTLRVQELEYAAGQTGTSFERLATAQGALTKSLDDMMRGRGRARDHFQEIGIDATRAAELMRDPAMAFDEIARKLVEIEEPGRRAAAAVRIFGEAGREVLAAMGPDGKGMSAAIARFEELNLAISDDTIRASQELGAAWRDISQSFHATASTMLTPGMQEFAKLMRFVADNSGSISSALSFSLRALSGSSAIDLDRIGALREDIERRLGLRDEWEGIEFPADLWDPPARPGPAIDVDWELPAGFGAPPAEQAADLRREQEIARIIERAKAYQMTEEELLQQRFMREIELVGDNQNHREVLEQEYADRIAAIRQRAAEAEERESGRIAQAEIMRYRQRLNARAMFASSMVDLTAAFLSDQHSVTKAFGIADAIVNTHAGVTQALRYYPPPQSWAMAAQSLAMGLEQVRAIKAASPSGNIGGSISTPSMPDFEIPDVPSVDPAPQAGGGTVVELHIQNMIGEESWVRNNLAPILRDVQRDGTVIVNA